MTRPVTSWENEAIRGMALSGERIHARDMKKIEALRKQQADYEALLPVEPIEVIKAALETMHPDGGENYPKGFEEALHLSHALRPMVETLDTDEPGPDRDALLYIADRIMFGLENAARKLDHISALLGTPERIERESRKF